MARRGCGRAALLAAVGCTALVGASARSQSAGDPTRTPPSPAELANERAAATEAAQLLTQVPLPPGATSGSVEPQGDDSLLAQPASAPATPNLVDDHAWWLVPGTPGEAIAYMRAQLPPGTRIESSGNLSGPGVPRNYSISIAWPPVAKVLAGGSLVIQAVELVSGATGLRADAQVVWITPRPPSEQLPRAGGVLRVSVLSYLRANQPNQRPFAVRSRREVDAIVTLLNSLPAAQPGTRNCPADFGIRVRLGFYATRDTAPLAVALIDPNGCGGVRLTLAGTQQPGLEGGLSLIHQIDHVLGVRLNLKPGEPASKPRHH
jgi:hypothetical protein